MTRINVGVDPAELPGKLLLAEHREITRIPNAVATGKARLTGIPQEFTLGAGHVKFFYDKLAFLYDRYQALYTECRRRGYAVTDKRTAFEDAPDEEALWKDYTPTPRDRSLIIERITSKGFELLQPNPA